MKTQLALPLVLLLATLSLKHHDSPFNTSNHHAAGTTPHFRRRKFVLGLALPLIAMIWLAASGIWEHKEVVSEMSHLQEMTVLRQYAGDLVHKLQCERRMTAAFLGSDGQNFRAELPNQRRKTDELINAFNTYTDSLVLSEQEADVAGQINAAKQFYLQALLKFK